MINQIRQGDVYLKRVEEIPNGLIQVVPTNIGYVLEEGEVTGHYHTISETEFMQMWKGDNVAFNELFLKTSKPTTLKHDEHSSVSIPAGVWRKITQREYSPEEIKRVID